MSRWIVTSFALHLAMMGFLYVTAVRWKPRLDLQSRLSVELAPAPQEEAEPTVATPAPTVAKPKPTAPPTVKKTPKKDPTPKKRTVKKAPKPVKTIDRTALLERLSKSRQKFQEVVSEAPPEPPPVRPVPLPRPTPRQIRTRQGPGVQAKGLEQFKDNYYFALMSNLFYENWQVPKRSSQEAIRSSVLTVVVLQSGKIDLDSCRWVRKSGTPGFDNSVWNCIAGTQLPPLPVEFRKSKIEVTVTFQDEV